MVSSVAACCVRPSYGAQSTMHCQWGWLSSFRFFCPWWPYLLTSELGRDFCTMFLTANFDHPTFSHSEVIVQTNTLTNKQTPLKTSTLLRYATLVGKQNNSYKIIKISPYFPNLSWNKKLKMFRKQCTQIFTFKHLCTSFAATWHDPTLIDNRQQIRLLAQLHSTDDAIYKATGIHQFR